MESERKRVLIVDDDRNSRRIFADFLNLMGFATVSVNIGGEALELLSRDHYFDLIITDVMMPYQTGFDLTKSLKEYAETRNIPVIATSAFHDWRQSRADHTLSVDGFVPKPVTKGSLLLEIRRILGK